MSILKEIRKYMDNNPRLKPYLLMWLRKTTKTINEWPQEKFIKGVMDCYERRIGYRFDINHPVTFNEKLQWYKVFYQCDDFGYITDKVTFKEYIKNKLGEGYTIPMYGWWDNIKDFERDWNSLPERFVLKSNLAADARGVMIIKKKSEVDFKDLKKKVSYWLKKRNTLLNSWDWHFYNSTPKILAEHYMEDESGELRDYKFLCFDGSYPYFKVDYGRFKRHHSNYYDANCLPVDLDVQSAERDPQVKITLPDTIVKMGDIACELSKGFPFVRVDFFSCNNRIYLSEMTFAPGGGCTPYPEWFDREMGERLGLPIDYQIDTGGVFSIMFLLLLLHKSYGKTEYFKGCCIGECCGCA
jgi:hypothetical protein